MTTRLTSAGRSQVKHGTPNHTVVAAPGSCKNTITKAAIIEIASKIKNNIRHPRKVWYSSSGMLFAFTTTASGCDPDELDFVFILYTLFRSQICRVDHGLGLYIHINPGAFANPGHVSTHICFKRTPQGVPVSIDHAIHHSRCTCLCNHVKTNPTKEHAIQALKTTQTAPLLQDHDPRANPEALQSRQVPPDPRSILETDAPGHTHDHDRVPRHPHESKATPSTIRSPPHTKSSTTESAAYCILLTVHQPHSIHPKNRKTVPTIPHRYSVHKRPRRPHPGIQEKSLPKKCLSSAIIPK